MATTCTNEYIQHDDYMVLRITSKIGTFEVMFDTEDYEKISQHQWHVMKCWNKNTTSEDKKKYYGRNAKLGILHRFIIDCPKDLIVDHADGNEFNCRKSNLRACTYSQNNFNKKPYTNNKSGYPGVCWFPYRGVNKWKAHIQVNGKLINLGYFDTKDEAIEVKKLAENKYFGEFKAVAL